MKNLILVSLLLASNSFAGIHLVSDLDDTIKITNSSTIESVGYGLTRTKVYAGMPEFLAEARSYSRGLHVVSASPRIIRPRVVSLLKDNKIKFESIIMNGNIDRPSHFDFKVDAISKLIHQLNEQIILLGDDMGQDPEIFDELMKRFPNIILASYIHVVKNRSIPKTVNTYLTSFDLALKEFVAGRLSAESVKKVKTAVLSAKEGEQIFPDFALCPTEESVWSWHQKTGLAQEAREVTRKMVQICKNPR